MSTAYDLAVSRVSTENIIRCGAGNRGGLSNV